MIQIRLDLDHLNIDSFKGIIKEYGASPDAPEKSMNNRSFFIIHFLTEYVN